MQDRFKFRVWYNPQPVYDDYPKMLYDAEKTYDFMRTPDLIPADSFGDLLEDKNFIVMQCTGLKDKNNKLIYEGDILKGKKNMICSPHSSRMIDKVGVVEIPQNMFVATCRDVKNNCTLFCQNDWVKTEVIGNIYENPELLEVENAN